MQEPDELEREKLKALQSISSYLKGIVFILLFGMTVYGLAHVNELQAGLKKTQNTLLK